MKTEEMKYTAGEAALIGVLGPLFIGGYVVLLFPLQVYAAWCDMLIWNWFAAPYLHLPTMSLWISFGIGTWLGLQTASTKVVKGEEISLWKGALGSLVMHSAALLVAYVVHIYAK